MKSRLSSLFLVLFASVSLFACIDDEATDQSIYLENIKQIDEYIEANPITNVKEFKDETYGVYMFWETLGATEIKPVQSDSVWVNYTGMTLSNRVFDTNVESVAIENNITKTTYEPLVYRHAEGFLIPGFELAVSYMEKGDKLIAIIPSYLAYGRNGNSGAGIGSNQPLIFEIELLDVKPQE